MNKKFLKENKLFEAHKQFMKLCEFTYVPTSLEEEDEQQQDMMQDPNMGGGDMMQGTAFSNMLLGEPAVASFNEMNFDAFVIGNHEFDWSIDNLSVYKDGIIENGELDCPFLGANIVDGEGNRPNWIEPYTIVNKGNVKVGIIGVIGDNLESSISKVALGNYRFTSTVESVNKYAKILLEDEKVNILIVSSHAHNEFANQSYVNTYEVDAIINGHDHKSIEETVNSNQTPKIDYNNPYGCELYREGQFL